MFYAGFFMSPMFEKVIAHLNVGAQKNTKKDKKSRLKYEIKFYNTY